MSGLLETTADIVARRMRLPAAWRNTGDSAVVDRVYARAKAWLSEIKGSP